ncbi:hypothetical protein [Amycolatopsis nigrescens]|uniref:hypothetical protein n=1 Tax=Amycolatopsis nigrescens TaxID=381445 RepID=UPI0003622C7F|nr:hypothetical protein [Amycolatopsis nigrescens]
MPADDLSAKAIELVCARVPAGRPAEDVAQLRQEERDVLLLTAWADLTPAEIVEGAGVAVSPR